MNIWDFEEITFRQTVIVVLPGGDEFEFEGIFRLLPRDESAELLNSGEHQDVDVCERLMANWDITQSDGEVVAYSRETLERLLSHYPTAGHAIIAAYGRAHAEAIKKNYATSPGRGSEAAAKTNPQQPAEH